MARLLHADGYRIVAVSDSKGGIQSDDGFDVPSLMQQKNESRQLKAVYCDGSVCEAVDATEISNDQLLELDVDMLIPAALEGVITADNAADIRASLVVEVANGPTTSRADAILAERGVDVLPDILANAGGVTVSYFEWVQNRGGMAWSLDQVNDGLAEIMARETNQVLDQAEALDTDLRTAAYVHALNRLGRGGRGHRHPRLLPRGLTVRGPRPSATTRPRTRWGRCGGGGVGRARGAWGTGRPCPCGPRSTTRPRSRAGRR